MRYAALVVGLSLVFVSEVAAQTTTGRLIGTTVDDKGSVLHGVGVSIDSPALIGGPQTKTSDERGEFVFLSLPPGDYQVRTEHAGFIPQERRGVIVPLGGAAAIVVVMPTGTFAGEIEVVYETPVVDPTQVNSGQIFDTGYMQGSAIGADNRRYNTVINQSAGVVRGVRQSGVQQSNILGSTIGENAYFIDGMDATNPTLGTTTASLNFDAIGEIQLQTGGFEAEYGRAVGGIINLITKSGGNRFSGSFDARYRDNSFQESGDHFDADELETKYQVLGATLGGPIIRDKVWFFASYEQFNDVFTPIGSPTTRDQEGQNYLGKITWQVASAWRLSGKFTSDPTTSDNWNASQWRMPDATFFKKGTTRILSTELNSVLSESLMWNTTLGVYDYESNLYPQHGDLSAIGHRNLITGLYTVSPGSQEYWETRRKDFTTDFTWFADAAGSHELKGGIEYSDLSLSNMDCSAGTPNGERCVENGVGFFFADITVGGQAMPYLMGEYHTEGQDVSDGEVSTVFVQDAWRPARNLTLKIGLRYDTVAYYNNPGDRIADMDMLQPRLGFAWDVGGNAKNVLRGNWGRFMHPNMLVLPYWVPEHDEPFYYWDSCTTGVMATSPEACAAVAADMGWDYRTDNAGWDPNGWILRPSGRFSTEPFAIVPDLRATYADELILAFEREVGSRSAIELTYIDKKTTDIVDDTCNGNIPTPIIDAECSHFVLANIDELKRDYRGVTVKYETRHLAWLTMLASYTYSSSKGSVGYTQNVSGVADLYPWHYENRYGYLGDHRRHRLKLNGYFNIKGDWTFAFDARVTSPFTWTPYETRIDNPDIPFGSYNLEPRGSREANNQYEIDLQISKGFTTGQVRFVLIGTVLNAMSSEQPTSVCEHISGCGSFEMGDPTNWQSPRRYELGFRVEF